MDRAAASGTVVGSGGGHINDSGMTGGSTVGGPPTGSTPSGVNGTTGGGGTAGNDEGAGVTGLTSASIESVKGGEMLMDALDLVHNELAALAERAANTTTTTIKHRYDPYRKKKPYR